MSHFIVTMPAEGLMLSPPESKVMPLPTKATDALAAGGFHDIVTMRGGFVEPCPTPLIPPNPPLTKAFSSSTETVTRASEAVTRFLTLSAKDCGWRWFGGVLTRSRAQSRARPSTAALATASRAAFPWPAPETTSTRGPEPVRCDREADPRRAPRGAALSYT